jgi:hypothetical protein
VSLHEYNEKAGNDEPLRTAEKFGILGRSFLSSVQKNLRVDERRG